MQKKRFNRMAWSLLSLGLIFMSCTEPIKTNPSEATDASERASEKTSTPDTTVQETKPLPENPIEGIGKVVKVSDAFVFSEGPLWLPKEKMLLFSDILTNKIYQLKPPSEVKVFREPTEFSNGLVLDHKGRLLAAERNSRRISRTLADGTIEALAEKFDGKRFHGPNDLTVRADGTVYFTDPPYVVNGPKELTFNGVFRIAPDGKVTAEWKGEDKTRPNGIILSPDEKRLYFADAAAGVIWVVEVKADGSFGTPKQFVTTGQTPDGMTIDTKENLFVATKKGVEVFSKEGKSWGVIPVPEQPTNCTFGDEGRTTLYITARSSLYKLTGFNTPGSH